MDSLIAAAARALATGDALLALKHVALRDDPPALALRGIALAQLGELVRARELLRAAARAFGAHEVLERARCQVAEAEVALALRDLAASPRALLAAARTLAGLGDAANAAQAWLVAARRSLLLGRLDEASQALAQSAALGAGHDRLPALQGAVAALTAAELAWRHQQPGPARAAFAQAAGLAQRAGVAALQTQIAQARAALDRPAARRVRAGEQQLLTLDAVHELLASQALVVDGCRRGLAAGALWLPLAGRPVLFALAAALSAAWPADVARQSLIAEVFRTRRPDETHRARLRVEIGRLRALIAAAAAIEATPRGYALRPQGGREVALLLPPIEGTAAELLALLGDGAAWSTSALALALGAGQRSVQRMLAGLHEAGQVRQVGQGRAQRWLAPPLTGFTTILLLPAALPAA